MFLLEVVIVHLFNVLIVVVVVVPFSFGTKHSCTMVSNSSKNNKPKFNSYHNIGVY